MMDRIRSTTLALLATLVLLTVAVPPTFAEDHVHIVLRGDTLTGIARRYGVSVQALASANGLAPDGWVYVGQRLVIPDGVPAAASAKGAYVVRPSDTLYGIAQRYGTTVTELVQANGLQSARIIYIGQRLMIPAGSGGGSTALIANPSTLSGEKWIDVNLTDQRLTAYVGQTLVFSTRVSTGTWKYPTVSGTYHIYVKIRAQDMSGGSGADTYYLPNVPHVMYFYRGYGFHGTYWHNNFGTPMSHGCVNLTLADAEWLFNWAEVGTKVVSHY